MRWAVGGKSEISGTEKKYSHDVLVRNDLDFPLLIVSPKPRMNRQFLRSARRSPANRCHRGKKESTIKGMIGKLKFRAGMVNSNVTKIAVPLRDRRTRSCEALFFAFCALM